jgi:Putative Flp pilus-assembly TadE/G-like
MRTLGGDRFRINRKCLEAAMTRKKEAGSILVFMAIALVVLMGFAGLAIDMGALRYQKRLQQTAADAAALAGASNHDFGGVATGARNAAAANGFADTSGAGGCPGAIGCITVTATPPASGAHVGNGNYVEALVTAVQPTYFMKVLGINSETITARAVATNLSGRANNGCLYTLGSAGIEGINISQSATLNAPACGIVDNGSFNTSGNVIAATFGTSGNNNKGGATCTVPSSPCPTPNTPVSADPLSYLKPPAQPGLSFGNVITKANQTLTLQPGTYTSITIGNTAKNSIATVIFNSGIYYINGAGGLRFNGAATVRGTGVMFYFTNGATIDATGGGNKIDMQLSAATSGPYAGILFYQDPNDTSAPQLGGDNRSFFQGALYFPESQLTFFGNNVSYSVGVVVADALGLSGSPTVNLLGAAGLPPGVSVIKNAVLVE